MPCRPCDQGAADKETGRGAGFHLDLSDCSRLADVH